MLDLLMIMVLAAGSARSVLESEQHNLTVAQCGQLNAKFQTLDYRCRRNCERADMPILAAASADSALAIALMIGYRTSSGRVWAVHKPACVSSHHGWRFGVAEPGKLIEVNHA
jgi:hypothetical protein